MLIDQTFQHVTGVGPVTERRIKQLGFINWRSLLENPRDLPFSERFSQALLRELTLSQQALDQHDIRFLIERLPTKEHWRILADYYHRISYFDIETNGLTYDAVVTVIVCYHRGQLHRFIRGKNLDDFLDLLDDIDVLASFNGSSFDVPYLLRTYHVPEIPCPHIDLRWQCYHQGLRGGLKQVERDLSIERPQDLQDLDGAEAVWLWRRWQMYTEQKALDLLLRYCAADVLSLPLLTTALLQAKGVSDLDLDTKNPWDLSKHSILI